MGLILHGIGIGGLGPLPSKVSIMTFPRMELMMGCHMMIIAAGLYVIYIQYLGGPFPMIPQP